MAHFSKNELTYTAPAIHSKDSNFTKLVKSAIVGLDEIIDQNPHGVTHYEMGMWYGFKDVLDHLKAGRNVGREYLKDMECRYNDAYVTEKKKMDSCKKEMDKMFIEWDVDEYNGKREAFKMMIGWM